MHWVIFDTAWTVKGSIISTFCRHNERKIQTMSRFRRKKKLAIFSIMTMSPVFNMS